MLGNGKDVVPAFTEHGYAASSTLYNCHVEGAVFAFTPMLALEDCMTRTKY
jgi:hypothetical protein